MSQNNALVESLERNMVGQISKFSLSFSSRQYEREYRREALRKRGVQLCTIMGSICLFQLFMFIMHLAFSNEYLIVSVISAPAHLLGYLFKRKYPHESHPEFTVAFFSVFNQVTYDFMLNNLSSINVKYIILGEFFITTVISIFFRTRVFVLDCLLLIFTRSFHTYFLEHIFIGGEVGITSVLTFLQVIMMAFYFYKSEKMEREKFLLKSSHSEWTEIIDKVLPVNVIISKFNQRTCEIMLGSCNGLSTKVFKIKDHESYNAMLSKMKISVGTDVENPNGQSLREFVMNKHFSIAEGKQKGQNTKTSPSLNDLDNNNNNNNNNTKIKPVQTPPKNKKSHDSFFNRNFINLIKSENPINQPNSNRSNNNNNNENNGNSKEFSGVEDKLKLISLRSLSNIGGNNNNNNNINGQGNPTNQVNQVKIENQKVENLVGFYREKDFSGVKKYNIKIYKMSSMQGKGDSTLVISLEDRTHTATLKIQKEQNQNTHQVLSKTLQHFQILVKRAMNSVNEGSSQFIPPLLLYNTLLLNMQIYNINDYLKIKLATNTKNNKSAINTTSGAMPEKDKQPQDQMNSSIQQPQEPVSKDKNNQFYFETLDLAELLQQLEKLMKRVCEERNIVFVLINETPEDQTIVTDKHKLYRVLINYISNSVNKTKKGYIQLRAISTATLGIPTIKFSVIDSGSGMSPRQQLPQIGHTRSNQNLDEYEEQISPTTIKKTKGMVSSNVLRASVGDKRHYKHLPLVGRNSSINNQLGNNNISSNINNNNNPSFMQSMNNSVSNFASMNNNNNNNNNNSNNGLFLQKNSSVIYQSNTSEDIATSALFPNSSIIAANSTTTDYVAVERSNNSTIKEGLGIGMLVSKYLINKMGPSFPKVYSKPGLGTNVTFEVYQDLQKMVQAHSSTQFPQQSYLQPTQLKKNNSKMSSFNFHNINSSPQQGPSGNNNGLREHLSSSSVINIATLNSNIQSQGNNPIFAPSPSRDTHAFFLPISNPLGNLNSSMNPSNNNANYLHRSYQSSEMFGNLEGNNNNYNSAAKSRAQNNVGQIQLDAEENIDEDGLEYLNLGGNCYKMIGLEDNRPVVSRSDNYLMQPEAETNASISQQFPAYYQFNNTQKKPQSYIQIGSVNPSFMNVATAGYSQSQLQPFSNAEIFPQPPHFGLNTSNSKNNSSKCEANSPQNNNFSNNNYNSIFASFNNNNSNMNNNNASSNNNNNSNKGGRSSNAFNFDKLNIANLNSNNNINNNNTGIQGSSLGSFPKTSLAKIDESLGLQLPKRESGETLVPVGGGQRSPKSAISVKQQHQQQQSNSQQFQQQTPLQINQAYSLKLIQSFPDVFTPQIDNNQNGHPQSNPINSLTKSPSPLLAHLQQPSEHSNNSLSGNHQEELGNFTSELHKAFNSIQQNTNPLMSSNINNNPYHQKKPSMKSSFNLIFDMKSNVIDYDPESQHNNSNLNINNSNLINDLTSHKPSPQSNSLNELSPHPQKTVKFTDNARGTLDEGLTSDQLFGGLTNPTRGRAISAKNHYSKQEYFNKIHQFQSSTLTSTQVLTAPALYGFHSAQSQPRERALSSLPQSSRSGKNYRISIGNAKESSHKLSQ